jgi:quercetin dioxygenase-like cupin family protein
MSRRPPLLQARIRSDIFGKKVGDGLHFGVRRERKSKMEIPMADSSQTKLLPPDDLNRPLALAHSGDDRTLPHIGLVGDTYTITVTGEDTAGRFRVIDMHVPPGGGPPPHRHHFEETFILLEGEIEATFRGQKSIVKAGDTATVPANAPHQFRNISSKPVRMLCICSPAGQEKFFLEIGVPVATRTTAPSKLNEEEQAEFIKKVEKLAPRYKTELFPT